jgi:hypothetical protein
MISQVIPPSQCAILLRAMRKQLQRDDELQESLNDDQLHDSEGKLIFPLTYLLIAVELLARAIGCPQSEVNKWIGGELQDKCYSDNGHRTPVSEAEHFVAYWRKQIYEDWSKYKDNDWVYWGLDSRSSHGK